MLNPENFVFEDAYTELIRASFVKGEVGLPDIIKLLRTLQSNEADCHCGIAGQNGSGKSIVLMMLQKMYQGEISYGNFFMADKTTNDIVRFLLTNRDTPLCIDEMNLYFNYKQHASIEQNHLINMVELARSKCIPIIGCVRDPRKLTLNYRDGKLSVVVWLLDRLKKGKGAYAAVFVANAMVEGEDRFGWQYLSLDSFDYEQMRYQMEHLPSFIGYMWIPPAEDVLTKAEIARYKKMKDVAEAYAHLNYILRQFKKGRMSPEDLEVELLTLEKIIPDARSRIPAKKEDKQSKLFDD